MNQSAGFMKYIAQCFVGDMVEFDSVRVESVTESNVAGVARTFAGYQEDGNGE